MVRLVFRPYAKVRRSICTSESRRASTRVSSGFALPWHRSPSFGSQRVRSDSVPPTKRRARVGVARGGRDAPARDHARCGAMALLSLSLRRGAAWLPGPTTRVQVRLLGPCFKTGREGSRSTSPPTRGRWVKDGRLAQTRHTYRPPAPSSRTRGSGAWRRRGDATGPPSNACVRLLLRGRIGSRAPSHRKLRVGAARLDPPKWVPRPGARGRGGRLPRHTRRA
jgi:hypothetical protein